MSQIIRALILVSTLCGAATVTFAARPSTPHLHESPRVSLGDSWHDDGPFKYVGQDSQSFVDFTLSAEQSAGKKSLSHEQCYRGETVGECAGRVVQEGLASDYLWLIIVGAVQALTAPVTVYIVFKQFSLSREMARESSRAIGYQNEERRLEGIRTHRPRLYVRNIVVTSRFRPGVPVEGRLVIANKGGSIAHIYETNCKLFWNTNYLPIEYIFEPEECLRLDFDDIHGGGSVIAYFDSRHENFFWNSDRFPGDPGTDHIYLIGRISYLDNTNTTHRTAFCRCYTSKTGQARFYPVDDPDYEYEE